jgi:hypothetical protein
VLVAVIYVPAGASPAENQNSCMLTNPQALEISNETASILEVYNCSGRVEAFGRVRVVSGRMPADGIFSDTFGSI